MTVEAASDNMDTRCLARTLLDLALEVEEAELRIKEAILQAAQRGDVALVETIITRWMTDPPVEVASSLEQ